MTFWDHLEELRHTILRCIIAATLAAIIVFCFKQQVFTIIFAPITAFSDPSAPSVTYHLINTELTRQFTTHMMVSFYVGMLVIAPYLIYQIYGFILPALKDEERRYTTPVVICSYIMFIIGLLFSYFILFPLTLRFLANYQVDASVTNLITLESYIDTLLFLCLAMGIIFELPLLSWLLGKIGLIKRHHMEQYRRHAFACIIIIAAIITPTTDAFTLMLTSVPMYILYEISIFLLPRQNQ